MPEEKLTAEIVREYLRNKENLDCVVMIYHAKVAQKSYGAEKRFFCPPPMVYLRGKGWKIRGLIAQNGPDVSHNVTGLNNNIGWSNDETSTNNTDYDYEEPRAFIGIVGAKDQDRHALEWQKDSCGRCAIKALHISENDNNRRKYFTLSVHCFYKSGQLLGKFESKRIKVISKPSKKKNITLSANSHNNSKQSDIKNQGINIASGTEIALFSRVRSQTTNTRYLFVKDGKFVAHSKFWGSFTIHLIDLPEDEHFDPYSDDFAVKDGFINYGSIVKLVDSVTGLALPMMALSIEKDGRVVFKDGAQWTIISTDTMHYRFYEALGPTPTEISPVPIVNFLEMHASDTVPSIAYVELLGQNFYPNLQVWIGSTPVQTFLVNKELIRFALPSLLALNKEEGVDFVIGVRQQSSPVIATQDSLSSPSSTSAQKFNGGCQNDFLLEFPLLLARDDGVIFATQLYVTYSSPKDLTNNYSDGVPRV
uniref:Uncharacterized protein n=1 Tax=Meloidogyne javanica TaxID=6303 RepID=A0A915M7W2_MELJA